MKPRFFLWTVGLVAVLLTASCAAATPAPVSMPAVTATVASVDPSVPVATEAVQTAIPVQAVATSRGPNLEATDPNTVSLASGQLQLVEFFRFT
ncbi:MAG: hypothetical protein U0Z26_16480 [Anaerolineales bacterium]